MRIKKLVVEKLFGVFDYEISLNTNEGITIIHGPNGFGKTAILRILSNFFNTQYAQLQQTAFDRFDIVFDNDSRIEIFRNSPQSESINIVFEFYHPEDGKKSFSPLEEINEQYPERSSNNTAEFEYIVQQRWLNLNESTVLPSEEAFHNFYSKPNREIIEPDWLREIKRNIPVRLIQSQRLLDFLPSNRSRKDINRPPMMSTVAAYSDEIASLMREKFKEYGTTSQLLDRSFPLRILQQQNNSVDVTEEKLRNQLSEIEKTRTQLVTVGLLDKEENPEPTIQSQHIDKSTRNTLSVYVEDVQKKLDVFTETAEKIDLLRRIINNKFSYSKKEISFSKEKGFVFKRNYHEEDSQQLVPGDLSSGEQHELVLLYELLFKVKPNSLVLIDEPELSLHVTWQAQFLQDIKEIMKLTDISVLIATHSPDIIQDRWDLAFSLSEEEE